MNNKHNSHTEIQQLRVKQIDLLFEQLPTAILGTAVAVLLMTYLLFQSTPKPYLFAWVGIYLVILIIRYAIARKYTKSNTNFEEIGFWIRLNMLGAGLSGLMMGVLPYLVNAKDAFYYLMIITLWVCGMTAAAMIHTATLLRVFFIFSLPAMAPLAFYLLYSGKVEYYSLAIIQLVFYTYLITNITKVNKAYLSSIKAQLHNTTLLGELNLEKDRVNKLNEELKLDIKERIEIEDELREEKNKVEELVKKLLMISAQDGLTGISNRRHFDEFLANEWGRSSRAGSPISLILCDIDNFKAYNDHYGHQEGDKCLCRISNILSEYARRGGDLAARYGGEEFAIILSDTNMSDAITVVRQIRRAIKQQAISHAASDTDNIVTASFGVATIVPNKDTLSSQLISRADRALYEAKQNGRDRVIPAELAPVDDDMKLA